MLTALYIHIPFCQKICTYCDFVKEIASFDKQEAYINALIKELEYYKDRYNNLKTIYIGGGTPSHLDDSLLEKLFKAIQNVIDMDQIEEFSIETNPNDIHLDKALLFAEYGINRVSMGVQTFNERQLSFLNRSHTNKDVYKAITDFHSAGITNINVDMIFSLINQNEQELLQDIREVVRLPITHISYYSLILEEKTRLMHLYDKGEIDMNPEDLEGTMYEIVIKELKQAGFEHYEISNFCKEGLYSKHNLIYWQNKDYIGIGAGAHGLVDETRYHNERSVKKYIEKVNTGVSYKETYEREALTEELMMGLRLLNGINVEEINDKYNIDLFKKYDKLHSFMNDNLLEYKDGYLKLSQTGLFIGNIIFGYFLEG